MNHPADGVADFLVFSHGAADATGRSPNFRIVSGRAVLIFLIDIDWSADCHRNLFFNDGWLPDAAGYWTAAGVYTAVATGIALI